MSGATKPQDEEDAAKLHLGPDFDAAKCLMAAEVKLVLDNKIATDKSKGETTSTTRTHVFEKTYAYVKRMSFPNATVETAHSIRQALAGRGLNEFEVAVVANLAPSCADEAKALVPSLDAQLYPERALADDDIEAMLNDQATYRNA